MTRLGIWMAALALALSGPAPALADPGPAPFDRLVGCWEGIGKVQGEAVTYAARGRRVLGGRFLLLELSSLPGFEPYSAALFFGRGAKPGSVVLHYLDTFGGEASKTLGLGEATSASVVTRFDYPTAAMDNRITLEDGRWRLRVTATPPGKRERLFAEYLFAPAACKPDILPLS